MVVFWDGNFEVDGSVLEEHTSYIFRAKYGGRIFSEAVIFGRKSTRRHNI